MDYKKRMVIIPQPVRVCFDCGHFAALRRDGWCCSQCGSYNIDRVMEDKLDEFRQSLNVPAE